MRRYNGNYPYMPIKSILYRLLTETTLFPDTPAYLNPVIKQRLFHDSIGIFLTCIFFSIKNEKSRIKKNLFDILYLNSKNWKNAV